MRLASGLPESIDRMMGRLTPRQLDMLLAALEEAKTVVDEIDEETALALLQKIIEPPPPTVSQILRGMSNADLRRMEDGAQTATDRYLAAAERLERRGLLAAPSTTNTWPIDYSRVYAWRQRELVLMQEDPLYFAQRKAFYASGVEGCVAFINHWVDTHDPRNSGLFDAQGNPLPVTLPLVMFERQEELVRFIFACIDAQAGGLIEKSRDMGATWDCVGISLWMWLFRAAVSVGWGSATAVKLDRSGDADSIFEKIRICIKHLPTIFKPHGLKPDRHLLDKRVYNPENAASVKGEVGDEIGRGGRTTLYFVDEAAHLQHPESVEKALSENTRVRIDISSVSGLGTAFHRARVGGKEWELGQTLVRDRVNVFIMDWSHHPAKSRQWHDERQALFESKGMAHVFASEVDRDYAAAVEGTIIPKRWLDACVDAHHKLGFEDDGGWVAGLDVADGGADSNALVKRKGWVVKYADQWGERDTAKTTRRAIDACALTLPIMLEYDAVGIGSGVKAESNRLRDDKLMPKGIRMVPWNAGGRVQRGGDRVVPNDPDSPMNKDFFFNLKAQGWWSLRSRVYRTFQAVTAGIHFGGNEKVEGFSKDDMIAFDSKSIGKLLYKLIEELAQPTAQPNTKMKMQVDKQPEGMKSPNLGDACMMCCFPAVDTNVVESWAFAPPIIVNASSSCLQCGSKKTNELGRNRYQCLDCGHVGSWE